MNLATLARIHFQLDLSPAQSQAFDLYEQQLIAWNRHINLTAITAPDEIRVKHFLDSLSLLTLPGLPEKMKVMDVGTGAGLPGLALKIMRPAWQVTLMDSTTKKVNVIAHIQTQLALSGVNALAMRAEEAGQQPAHREQYDLVVARAVARMPTLVEYLLPLCKVGGLCVAMKGATAKDETADAAFAIQTLGGKLEKIQAIQLPGIEDTHYLACIRKIKKTPKKYPRRTGIPKKTPLEKNQKTDL